MSRLPVIYIGPGEMCFSESPSIVATVLGSCISVTMFNRRLSTGAICHGFLPRCKCRENCAGNENRCIKKNGCSGSCEDKYRFVDCAVHFMLKAFREIGVENDELEIKLFGGSNFIQIPGVKSRPTVGMQNIQKALEIIKVNNLKLNIYHVGGMYGRKLHFHTHTGEVFLKNLNRNNRGQDLE